MPLSGIKHQCMEGFSHLKMQPQTVHMFSSSNGVGGVLGSSHKTAYVPIKWKKARGKQGTVQTGGMLPGLIISAILAKKRKKNVGKAMGNYMKRGIGARIAVAKSAAQKKVPTPGNTGMSAKQFVMSGLFGLG